MDSHGEIHGTFTLKEMLQFTYTSKYRTRFDYMKRDVILRVEMIEETELHPDRPSKPDKTFIFQTRSYPQYYPYTKHLKGTTYQRQRKHHHQYDAILAIKADENGQYSLNTKTWKYRLGSQKAWMAKPPQKQIKSIYRPTMEAWKQDLHEDLADIKFMNPPGERRDKLIAKRQLMFKKKVDAHRKSAKYLDAGDYNSQVRGINGDFAFRVAPTLYHYGHLYGKQVQTEADGDFSHPFLPKHALRLIDYLIKQGILHD